MKKITFKNSKGLALSGVLHIPREKTKQIVIIAHGFTSGKDRSRMVNLAEKIVENGLAAFRFDFGGHGRSEDRIITVKDQIDDYRSAIDFVISQGYSKVGLMGSSFGGLCSILVYSKKISTMVLWAANTKSYFSPLLTAETKKEIERKGYMDFEKPDKKFKIGKDYFAAVSNIDQEKILSKIQVPILVMHGDKDDIVPLQDSKDAMKFLPANSKLVVIKGASHNFEKHLDEISAQAISWFKKYL